MQLSAYFLKGSSREGLSRLSMMGVTATSSFETSQSNLGCVQIHNAFCSLDLPRTELRQTGSALFVAESGCEQHQLPSTFNVTNLSRSPWSSLKKI